MGDSFRKRWSRLQSAAQQRNLLGTQAPRGKFFERAQGNAVGFAQGTIDGAGFSHAHLGIVEDQRRDIAGMSIAVADEPSTFGFLKDGGLEHPEVLLWMAEWKYRLSHNPWTLLPLGQPQQIAMCHEAGADAARINCP